MVVIRLARHGSKGKPFYQMVAADKRASRNGKNLERLGFFNPSPQGKDTELKLDLEKIDAWLAKGAQPSDTAKDLISKARKLASVAEKVAKKTTKAKTEKAEDK